MSLLTYVNRGKLNKNKKINVPQFLHLFKYFPYRWWRIHEGYVKCLAQCWNIVETHNYSFYWGSKSGNFIIQICQQQQQKNTDTHKEINIINLLYLPTSMKIVDLRKTQYIIMARSDFGCEIKIRKYKRSTMDKDALTHL